MERDRRRFIAGRGILRAILGRYTGVDPSQVLLCYGSHGKPYLAEPLECRALCFNLAHSHELALYALTYGRKVGIDLEHVRPMPDAEHLVTRFFSAREQRIFQALPETQKQEAFFNCWTRKEAFLKATGKGLTRPLDTFDVSLAPGKAARLLSLDGEPPKTDLWSLKTFIPAAGSVATLAVEGSAWRPVFLEYQPI